ncbi:MAG: hypothetical protein AAFY71_24740 [Bacteroidota bacterium]
MRKNLHLGMIMILLGIVLVGMTTFEGDRPKRPVDNWVFTADLDGQENVLVAALYKDLWVAYDRATCKVLKTWRGGVILDPQTRKATSQGFVYYEEEATAPAWKVIQGGQEIIPKAKMGNVTQVDDSLTINYTLYMPDGHEIWVQEAPEAIVKAKDDNRVGLERKITVGNMPLNADIVLPLRYRSMLKKKDISSTEKVKALSHDKRLFDFGTIHDMEVEAMMNRIEPTIVKMMFTFDLEKASRQ